MGTEIKISNFQDFLFAHNDIRGAFNKTCKARSFSKGNIIVGQGETGQDIFLLSKGKAKVVIYSEGGNEIQLSEFPRGTLFGEMAGLLNSPRSSNVVAQTECSIDIIPARDFNALMVRFPDLALYMTQLLAQRLQQTSQSLFESLAFTVPQRVYEDLLRRAQQSASDAEVYQLSPAPSVTALSEALNVSREATSRAMTKLIAQGIVKKQKAYWEILQVSSALCSLAATASSAWA